MVNILLDTEFTHIDAPSLISVGMTTPDHWEFYVELTDSWSLDECSLFVLGRVLPWLDNGEAGNVLRGRLGDLYHVIRWLTVEDLEARKKMLASPEVQKALVKEHRWALDHTGLQDVPAAEVPRIVEALDGLELDELVKGKAGRKRREAARETAAWLSRLHGARIMADSPIDLLLLQKLLRASGDFPRGLYFGVLGDMGYKIDQETREAYYRVGARRHHALDDARALAGSLGK